MVGIKNLFYLLLLTIYTFKSVNGQDIYTLKECIYRGIEKNMDLIITLAAIEQKFYPAKLVFIAPKGVDEAGAVQFKIEGEVFLDDEYIVRAGYSANATIITNSKTNVNALPEAVIQYDLKTKEPYVEIETS